MNKILTAATLVATLCLNAAAQYCPGCIQNSSVPQNAQFNVSSATIRGHLNVGSVSMSTINVAEATAGFFFGDGSSITNLNADELGLGTVPSGVLSGTYSGITGVGTLGSGVWHGSPIGSQYGGTGANLVTSSTGSLPYFSSVGVMSSLAPTTAGFVLQTNGASSAPSWTGAPQVLGTNVTGIPMANLITGQLPMAISVNDASLSTVSASKVIGSIPGNSANINGILAIGQLGAGTLNTSNAASSVTASGVTPGIYGGPNYIPQLSVAYDGRITGASQSSFTVNASQITSGPLPSGVTIGAAQVTSGHLSSSVVASSIAATGVIAGSYGFASQTASFSVTSDGRITFANDVPIAINTTQINDGTLPLGVTIEPTGINAGALNLNVIASSVAATGVSAGTYGGSGQIPVFTVSADGRLTSASQFTVPTASTQVAHTDVDNNWSAAQTSQSSWTINNSFFASTVTAGTYYGDGSHLTNVAGVGETNTFTSSKTFTSSVAMATQSGNVKIFAGTSIIGSSLTLTGSSGYITSGSSVNASAFFGNGANLTGISAAASGSNGYVQYSSAGILAADQNFTWSKENRSLYLLAPLGVSSASFRTYNASGFAPSSLEIKAGSGLGLGSLQPGADLLEQSGLSDTFPTFAPTMFLQANGNFAQSAGSGYLVGGSETNGGGYVRVRGGGDVEIYGNSGGIGAGAGTGTGTIYLTPGSTGGAVRIGTGGSTGPIQIGGSSFVGIANGSPSFPLDVTGDIRGTKNMSAGLYEILGSTILKMGSSGTVPIVLGNALNDASASYAIVAGGNGCFASGPRSAVIGGFANFAGPGSDSFVGAGSGNNASGSGSVVLGGGSNSATGVASYALGQNATSQHSGSFVYCDGTSNCASSADDQFDVRAIGGINLTGDITESSGSFRTAGGVVASTGVFTSTLTVQGNAFSVGTSSFTVSGGSVAVAYRLTASSLAGDGSNVTNVTASAVPASGVQAGSLGASVIASSIAVSGVTAGTYGSATQVSQVVVGGDGRITSAANVTISGVPAATVPASGVLAGSLGSSVIASSVAVGAVLDASIVSVSGSKVTGNISGNAANITGNLSTSQIDLSTVTAAIATKVSKAGDTMTGGLLMSGSSITLTGSSGYITSGSSITASAFYGNGSNLTGVSATESNTFTSSKTFTAGVLIKNSSLTLTGSNGYIVSGSSVIASAFYGNGSNLTGITASTSIARGGAGVNSAIIDGSSMSAIGNYSIAAGGLNNSAEDLYSAVVGGSSNTSTGEASGIVGGESNLAIGNYSFIGGGTGGFASSYGFILGGLNNQAIGDFSVAGGQNSTASDTNSVAIGDSNTAAQYSFAFGKDAHADDTYSFVWSDGTGETTTASNQFRAVATGGVFLTAQVNVTGVLVSSTPIPSISCNAGTGVLTSYSNSSNGRFTAGTGAASCTVTFQTPWPFHDPSCSCNDETTNVHVRAVGVTTSLTCDVPVSFSNDVITYGCQGAQ